MIMLKEIVGQKISINEFFPRIDGVYLKKGMKVKLKSKDEMLKNHYYEHHPELYKKMIDKISNTEQTIEKVYDNNNLFIVNTIKLYGFDLLIEPNDIEYIKNSAGSLIITKSDINKLKNEIVSLIKNYLSTKIKIDVKEMTSKEISKIIKDIANMVDKENN